MGRIDFIAYETRCSITIHCEDGREEDKILWECKHMALDIQKILNMYDEHSELSIMCRDYEPGSPYEVSETLYEFMKINLDIWRITEGIFDFTVGRIMKEWNFVTEKPQIPEQERIRELLSFTGAGHIELRPGNQVVFDVPEIMLDPGASGKGYAMDCIVNYLKSQGIFHGVLDFGGQIYVMGKKHKEGFKEEPWRIGVKDPDAPERICKILEAADESVATSSCYEHFFEADGKKYSHIIHPLTGLPAETDLKSVTIICKSALWADALSTTCFLMGKREGEKFIHKIEKHTGMRIGWAFL